MDFPELEKQVKLALEMFFNRDSKLLERDSSEWSIAHRLAVYLEQLLPGWNIDCEYNRQGTHLDPKESFSKIVSKDKKVRPDIIIHHRGHFEPVHNLLVIEIKKKEDTDDLPKVCEYTKPASGKRKYQYQYGLALSFDPTSKLTWFREGEQFTP